MIAGNAMGDTVWHIVRTKPRAEFEAAYHLGRAHYRAWAPYCFAQTRHAKRVTDCRRPVFTGYVFLGRSPGRGLLDAQYCRGVSQVVMFGDDAAVVPPRVVRSLMDECESDGWMRSKDDHPSFVPTFKPKQKVKIHSGPLENFIVQINSLDDDGKLNVSVEMFGANRLVSLPSSAVTAIASSP